DSPVGDGRLEEGLLAQGSCFFGIGRSWISEYRDVVLKLDLLRISELEHRSVFDFNLYYGNVLALTHGRAERFYLERKRASIGCDHNVNGCETAQHGFLGDCINH